MNSINVHVEWTIKERINGLWVPVREFHNLLTTYGLNTFATAPGGNYVAPIYLVIDTAFATLQGSYVAGSTVVQTDINPTVGGDIAVVFGAGQVGQETVPFVSIVGSGPYTITLSTPLINTHNNGEPVLRAPTVADNIASVVAEAQYDTVFAANKRAVVTSSYATGSGTGTMQFFLSGTQATGLYFAHIGMADKITIGQGNLHNYAVLGYTRNTLNDLEIDVLYQLTNI